MQSAWNDRDADAAVDRYKDLGRDLALAGLHHASVGRGSAAGAAWRRQHLGEDAHHRSQWRRSRGALRQGLRLGHGHDRARGAACGAARAAVETARARKIVRRGDGAAAARQSDRSRPRRTLPWRRCCTPSSRTNSSTTPIPPRCSRSPTSPTAKRCAARYFAARVGYVPYIMPGFGLAKAAAEVFEADPAVEGLVLVKHGIFSFGADAREAYERMIALVTLGRRAAGETAQAGICQRKAAGAPGARSPTSRRSSAAPAACRTARATAPGSVLCSISAAMTR